MGWGEEKPREFGNSKGSRYNPQRFSFSSGFCGRKMNLQLHGCSWIAVDHLPGSSGAGLKRPACPIGGKARIAF
eukprot:2137034-Rhodomonas_salina.1